MDTVENFDAVAFNEYESNVVSLLHADDVSSQSLISASAGIESTSYFTPVDFESSIMMGIACNVSYFLASK